MTVRTSGPRCSITDNIGEFCLEPTLDRLIIKQLEPESITKGGIHLPDTAKGRPQKGKVLAVGPGKPNDAGVTTRPPFQKGDIVLYSRYAGNEVDKDDFPDIIILSEADVLAIIHEA